MSEKKTLNSIIEQLDYTNGIVENKISNKISGQPLKHNIAQQTFTSISEIDSIYFSGEHPLIYFRSLSTFDDTVIKDLHKKIWNQGRVPLLFISAPTELRIYNCYQHPLKEDESIQSLEIDRFSNSINELDKLKSDYHQSKIDSGLFWESTPGKQISTAQKVDQLLVKNLRETRKKLIETFPKDNTTTLSYIHNLLGRSLFILYLQDRGIINSKYYSKYLENAVDYFSILENKNASYALYRELNERFNGDLFTVTSHEEKITTKAHLAMVRKCFYGDDVGTGQLALWRMFDFSFIPIELISAIYEEFLHTEEDEDAISNQGAYYTPQPLVEFILNEVLPFPDENNKKWDLKILDPACGSGIFLVEAYRRLIERWKYCNKNARISVDTLRQILISSIHGVEQNSEAIKVASFSLYLTILNYLEPKSIWANRNIRFPHLINSNEKSNELQGNNLFHGDTFENEEYSKISYDLIIGNPPWKRGNLSRNLNRYIKEFSLGNEAVLPFLHKMARIAPNAKIALVSTAKILFNTTSGYKHFRTFLFEQTKVDCIVNFSALRKSRGEIGRKLFASASGPTIVIFYNGINNKERNKAIAYCVPKPQYRDSALSQLIIDASDIKFIPYSEALNPKSNIWKIAMWGTYRDYQLINEVNDHQKIGEYFENENWSFGNGFQLSFPCDKPNSFIRTLPHLPTKNINSYYTSKVRAVKINDKKFRRLGCISAYLAPHVLIKKGQQNNEFCASYIDYDCSFKDGVYGIAANKKSKIGELKSIAAYLNSEFVSYYLFMTSSSWGIEREQIFATEVLDIPTPDFLEKNETTTKLAKLVDKIAEIEDNFTLGAPDKLKELRKEINLQVNYAFKLKKDQNSLLRNVIDYGLDFFQKGAKSKAILPVQKSELIKYAKVACGNMTRILPEANTNFWASIYAVDHGSPLTLVSFHFNNENMNGTIVVDKTSDVNTILRSLNKHVYQQHSESIYFRKIVKHYDNEVLFMVKPNERRFWTEAVALEDSDDITIELIVHD